MRFRRWFWLALAGYLIGAGIGFTVTSAFAHHARPVHLTTGHDVFSVNTLERVHVYAYGGDDHVHVGDFNDWLEGMYGDDYLNGGGGNDVLIGGMGKDVLVGGPGWDECIGNSGADTFYGCEVVR